jgi:predicted transcriptional regulator
MSYEDTPVPLRDAVTPPPPSDTSWLQTPVRAFMRPGVVTLAEDASLLQVQRAMVAHGVHAVLITAAGGSLGWVTASGLLPWLAKESALYSAQSAITERVASIPPGASARDALQVLSDSAVSHLVVSTRIAASPQGVVSEIDLVRLASGG